MDEFPGNPPRLLGSIARVAIILKTIVLVNPPLHRAETFDLSPPLGLLVLASVAKSAGWRSVVLDLNLPPWPDLASDSDRFYSAAIERIVAQDPDAVGFTSMGVNTHVGLDIATRIKSLRPECCVIAGGPHLSSIAEHVRRLCPAVDAVLRGEAESALYCLLSRIDAGESDVFSGLMEKRESPDISHPFASYSDIDLAPYFEANPRRLTAYEGGRGCVFSCAFCYSPSHYGSVRNVPPSAIVADWHRLHSLGFRHVFMIQDNLTNNPRWSIDLCEAIISGQSELSWNGYATLPQLSAQVIRAFGRAGCRGLYLGVDAVAETQRVSLNKRFFRGVPQLVRTIQELREAGVQPTCAVMVDLRNLDPWDIGYIFRVAADCSAAGASIRINTLTRYPGTALRGQADRIRYSEAKIRIALDCPPLVIDNSYAKLEPSLFPFHSSEVESEELWQQRLRAVSAAQALIQAEPRVLDELPRDRLDLVWPAFEHFSQKLFGLSDTNRSFAAHPPPETY